MGQTACTGTRHKGAHGASDKAPGTGDKTPGTRQWTAGHRAQGAALALAVCCARLWSLGGWGGGAHFRVKWHQAGLCSPPPFFSGQASTPKQAFRMAAVGKPPFVCEWGSWYVASPTLSSNLPRNHPWFIGHAKRVQQAQSSHGERVVAESAESGIWCIGMPNNWANIATSAFRGPQSSRCSKVRVCHRRGPPPLFDRRMSRLLDPPPLGGLCHDPPP